MKNLGKLSIIIFSLLSVIAVLWVSFTPGATSSKEIIWDPNKPVVGFIIIILILALIITTVLFLYYKVLDLFKHKSHMKEALYVIIPIIIAVVLGAIFATMGDSVVFKGEVYNNDFWVGTGILTALFLFIGVIALLVWDVVKGIIKG